MSSTHEENRAFFDHIVATTSSGIAFKANYEKLLDQIAKPSRAYIIDFIRSIEKILLSQEFPPTSKFYALFLLLKATEVEEKQFYAELSTFKELLNKLFLDAQFDANAPYSDKGNKFFSQKPTIEDSIIGNNYLRLVLESMPFWSEKYGSTDKRDPGNIYYIMCSSLKKIKFPTVYHYVNRTTNITPDFHLKQDFDEEEKTVDQAAINIKAFMQVTSCISTGAEYKLNSKPVFDSIAENSSVYCDSLLDTITEVLESKDYPPKSKFYALYLLVQVTETQNKVFLTRFAHRKSLLTKFAQVVLNDCSAKGRGERLFPELANTPDAVIGKNYITLLLEAIKFWDAAFGSSDINSPFNAFRTLDSSIWKFADFPHKYFYVGQYLDPEGDEMGKSLSVFDPVTLIPEDLLTNHENGANDPTVAREHVNECVSSGEAFKHTFDVILDALHLQNQEYIDIYLRTISEVISAPNVNPVSKFYALYLLAKSTEYNNETLIITLGGSAKELLSKIFQDAQVDRNKPLEERGVTLYSKEPDALESTVGKYTLRLILEALIFWDQNFGSEEKGSPGHMFRVMFSSLNQKKMQFPEEYLYIGSDIDVVIAEVDESLRSLGYQTENRQDQLEGFDLNQLVNSLAKLNENKIALRHLLENNTSESTKTHETIPARVEAINNVYVKTVEPHMEGLLKNNNPNLQKYVTDVFTEGELVDGISAEYSYYSTKRTNYLQFRNAVLKLLKEHDIGTSATKIGNSNDDLSQRLKTKEAVQNKPDDEEFEFREESPQKVEKPKAAAPPQTTVVEEKKPVQPAQAANNTNNINPAPVKESNQSAQKNPGKEELVVSHVVPQSNVTKSPEKVNPAQSTQNTQISGNGVGKSSVNPKNDMKASAAVDMGKSRVPEAKLQASLNEIAQSIVVSKSIATDTMNKKSTLRGNQMPPLVPRDEIRKKQKLEEEVSRLRKEKLELSKEASVMMRSNILNESPKSNYRNLEESILNSQKKRASYRGGRLDESHPNVVLGEYEKKIEHLERQLEVTQEELQKKEYQTEGMRKTNKANKEQKEVEKQRILEENNQLAYTLKNMTRELETVRSNSPEKQENQMLESHLRELDKMNKVLSGDVENLQSQNNTLKARAQRLERNQYNTQASEDPFVRKTGRKSPIRVSEKVYGTAAAPARRRDAAQRARMQGSLDRAQGETEYSEYLEPVNTTSPAVMKNGAYRESAAQNKESAQKEEPMVFRAKDRLYTDEGERASYSNGPSVYATPRREFLGHSFRSDLDNDDTRGFEDARAFEDARSSASGRKPTKTIKPVLGQINPTFVELERSLSKKNLLNFKLSCLKEKSVLHESKTVKVGITSVLLPDYSSKKKLQKLVLYYANTTNEYIDSFNVAYEGNQSVNCVLKPDVIERELYPGKQIKQQALCFIENIPFECPQLNVSLSSENMEEQFEVNLPCLITKFMEFKYTSFEDYNRKYYTKTKEVLQTEVITLNRNIINSGNDFKNYFDYLIDLNPMNEYDFIQEKANLHFGGVFELDVLDLEYYLKIRVSPSLKATFQIVADRKDSQIVKLILETLVFLFKA